MTDFQPSLYKGTEQLAALEDDEPDATSDGNPDGDEDNLDQEELTYKERYANLRRREQQLLRQHREELDNLKQEMKAATPAWTPPKSKEEMAEFAAKHPDLYGVFETIAYEKVSDQLAEVEELKQRLQAKEAESAEEEANRILNERHPEWEILGESDDFHEWIMSQRKQVQDWVFESVDGELAARVFDMYKMDRGLVKTSKKNTSTKDAKAAAAEFVAATNKDKGLDAAGKRIWKESEIQRMSLREYEKHEDEIRAAQREGRLLRE